MTMDGLVSDDIFSLPLVLPSPSLNRPVSLINCNGWELEVGKEEAVPLVILDNGELSLRSVNDLPLFLGNNVLEENVILEQSFASPEQTAGKPVVKDSLVPLKDARKEETDTRPRKQDVCESINSEIESAEISESCLMDNLVETVIMYKCKLCSFKSTEKHLLAVHIKNVHLKMNTKKDEPVVFSGESEGSWEGGSPSPDNQSDQLVYMCGSCNEAFTGFGECRVHMAQHHKIMMGSKPSPKNDEVSPNREMYDPPPTAKPMDDNKSEKTINSPCERTIECPLSGCQSKFATRLGLSRHEACHTTSSPKEFVCNYCSTFFSKWSMCANHLWRIHNIDVELFSCTECKYKTATRVKMKNHMQIHGKCKDYMCKECGKMFSQQSQLRNHEVTHLRTKTEDERPKWYTKKECEQCQKIFANSKSLKKHVQAIHSKLKPYVCHVCGHTTASKNMLQIHLRQHTGEKPFSCPSCPFTTGDHNSLRRHRMRHTGVRPYRCPHCPYSSIQNCSLKHHLMTWHQGDKTVSQTGKKEEKSNPTKRLADSSNLESELLSAVETNFSTLEFDLETSQVSVTVANSAFEKSSLDAGIMLSSNQQDAKGMVIQIPMSPVGMSYLENETLDSGEMNSDDIVTFE